MRGTGMDHAEATLPSPSPPSSSSFASHFSPGHHFYVAVDRLQFKMETLLDLLGVAGRRQSLPIVICCSSRDELDAVCASVSNLSFISLTPLYSDLADNDRALILEKFRHSSAGWNQNSSLFPGDGLESSSETKKSCMIVVTDACLPLVGMGEAPLSARVVINYELPTKKEVYLRRMSTCLAADGIVINMVVGGEVVTLRGLEESSGLIVAEMPINISEII
ncbi:ATP-dependent RNA helicase eIF4A-like [Zingiber officinale]|uniref:Eukaryotic initiation factor 4A n=1 Tax=Zingiber officinale TaxID=94328 RepID=A0A8J5KU19_ZINOF|nr:ATP-dependent RNA helicase eIF4A-like [Zingiber officinale]KAG6491087.1 hypothetical protein ZIOFF_052419 [Zingiber officinale]